MEPSTKDEVAGKVHEVKGKIKEKAGQLTNNPDLEEPKARAKTSAGNSKRKSAKWRRFSANSCGRQ